MKYQDKIDNILEFLQDDSENTEAREAYKELAINDLKALREALNIDLVSGLLPTIEDSGVIGLTIAEKAIPKLSENETAFFIAGFMEAIKYIKTNNR